MYNEEYRKKLITPEQAALIVESGNIVDLLGFTSVSTTFDKALAKRVDELKDIKVRTILSFHSGWEMFKVDPEHKVFMSEPVFADGIVRRDFGLGNFAGVPSLFNEYPRMYEKGDLPVDVGTFAVSPMDEDGYFHMGPSSGSYGLAMARAAKTFIAEVNTNVFKINNSHDDIKIHISEVDYIIEGENSPISVLPDPPATGEAIEIGKIIVNEIIDGACLQVGIGAIPQAVVTLLSESDIKDLGVHTELFADGLMKLCKSGKVTNKRKTFMPGISVTALAMGTKDFYEFCKTTDELCMLPVNVSNDPYNIGLNDNVVAINGCLEIDLTGQVNSESMGPHMFSGTGGQLDYVLGAYRSKGGKSIVCASSTFKKKDGTLGSRIVPFLKPGSCVTDPRASMQYVCTEKGIVNLKGCSMWTRSEKLISIAHPSFRDELIKEAENMKIWRPSNKR